MQTASIFYHVKFRFPILYYLHSGWNTSNNERITYICSMWLFAADIGQKDQQTGHPGHKKCIGYFLKFNFGSIWLGNKCLFLFEGNLGGGPRHIRNIGMNVPILIALCTVNQHTDQNQNEKTHPSQIRQRTYENSELAWIECFSQGNIFHRR